MSDAIIELENVTKSFGGVVANRAVSLKVPRGSITGLIGPGLFTGIFAEFIRSDRLRQVPGAPFFLAAGLLGLAFLLTLAVARPQPRPVPN